MHLDTEVWGGVMAAGVAAGVSTLGLLSMVFLGDWARRNSPSFSAFAFGFLVIAIFFHLFPESFAETSYAWLWVIAGFLGVSFISLSVSVLARRRIDGRDIGIGYASIIALAAHSFIDGLAYETTFRLDFLTGAIATFALLLHKFPDGVIAYFLAREAGAGRYMAGVWAFLAASLTTILGALLVAFALPVGLLDIGALIGLAAGGLLYICVFHLGWHARQAERGRGYSAMMFGVAVSLAAVVLASAAGFGDH